MTRFVRTSDFEQHVSKHDASYRAQTPDEAPHAYALYCDRVSKRGRERGFEELGATYIQHDGRARRRTVPT